MNKAFYITSFLLIASLSFVSCDKSIIIENEPEVIQGNQENIIIDTPSTVTFTCTIAADPTKVTIDNTGKTAWEMTDKVFFKGQYVGESGENVYSVVVSPSSISSDGKTATFEVDSRLQKYERYDTELWAAYPADAVKDYSNGENWYYWVRFKETNQPLMVGVNNKNVDGGKSFTFFNCCAAITFQVSGGYDAYKFEPNKADEVIGYTNYQVRAHYSYHNDGAGIFTFNDTTEGGGGSPTSGPIYSFLKTDWTGADGSTVNSLYFPNGMDFSQGFKITLYNDGTPSKILSTHTHITLARNDFLPLGNITSKLKSAPADDHELADWAKTATDFTSGGETANCYIVPKSDAGKKYKIPAVKGNDKLQTLTPYSAEILWETYNDNTTPASINVIEAVDYDEDYVYFQMANTLVAGNALIAAKNALGEIVWSWHIWVPDDDIDHGTYDISNSTRELMDRNLGALVVAGSGDVKANGLMYQWGRKDPFLGIAAQGSSTIATMTGTGTKTMSGGASDVATSIKNPTMFILSTGSTSDHDWVKTNDTSLWGTTKTIYDPCPPGWKVPAQADLTVFNTNAHVIMDGVSGWYDSAHYCATVKGTVFPLTGVLQYYDGNNEYYGTRTGVWSTTTADWADGCAVWMDIKSGPTSTHAGERKGRAASVRCIEISHP